MKRRLDPNVPQNLHADLLRRAEEMRTQYSAAGGQRRSGETPKPMVAGGAGHLQSKPPLPDHLNELPSNIALLDEKHVVVSVNRAWCRFAEENGMSDPACGLGLDYRRLAMAAAADGDPNAEAVVRALDEFERGDRRQFRMLYPCDSPQEPRWFELRISGVEIEGRGYLLVVHHHLRRGPDASPSPVPRSQPQGT